MEFQVTPRAEVTYQGKGAAGAPVFAATGTFNIQLFGNKLFNVVSS